VLTKLLINYKNNSWNIAVIDHFHSFAPDFSQAYLSEKKS